MTQNFEHYRLFNTKPWKTAADNKVFTSITEFAATQPGGTGITYKVFQRNDIE
jgi:hypothetical protein